LFVFAVGPVSVVEFFESVRHERGFDEGFGVGDTVLSVEIELGCCDQ